MTVLLLRHLDQQTYVVFHDAQRVVLGSRMKGESVSVPDALLEGALPGGYHHLVGPGPAKSSVNVDIDLKNNEVRVSGLMWLAKSQ